MILAQRLAFAGALMMMLLPAAWPAGDESAPVTVDVVYTADVLHNASGGLRDGTGALQNIDVIFVMDLERWLGLREGVVTAYFLWNDDNEFSSRYPGDAQVVSNIDAVGAFRLFEFWYERELTEAMNFRLGLYDLNSEFDAIDTAGLFLNSSHGIGAEYAQTGENGPSIFPATSLAARLQWQLSQRSILRYALLDGVPGDPADPSATRIDLGGSDGVLHALELDISIADGARLGVGGFLYSADFETIDQTAAAAGAHRDDGNGGAYFLAEAPVLTRESGDLRAFLRFGVANQKINPYQSYIGAGAVMTGLFGRPEDQLGFAVASARTGDDFRSAATADAHETTIELTYSVQVNDWLRLQPDIQYVINPGVDPSLKNAFVLGLRFEAGRQFTGR